MRIDPDTLEAIKARSDNAYRGEPACQAPVDVKILLSLLPARATPERRSEVGRMAAKARNEKLSPERRSEIARLAAKARWGKDNACVLAQKA